MSEAVTGSNPIRGVEAPPPQPKVEAPPAPSGSVGSFDGTLQSLKESEPEVYDLVMQGIAQTMCNQARKDMEQLKKMNREARRQDAS